MNKKWICGLLAAAMIVTALSAMPAVAESDQNPTDPTQKTTAETIPAPEQETEMQVSEQFVELLKQMEGFTPYPMWDYHQYSIGYGTRCEPEEVEYYKTHPMTKEEATIRLHKELDYFESEVRKYGEKYDLHFTQNQFDALVSFSYNCGASWTRDEAGYFNTAVRAGDMGTKLIYGMCLWSIAGSRYILINRRMCEANMYINGIYKNSTNPNNVPENYRHVFLDGNGGIPKYPIHGYDSQDKSPVITNFREIPTGTDSEGKPFAYEFAGWFTDIAAGTEVKVLDGSLPNGTVLYARWKDPQGNVVQIPRGEEAENVEVTVTGQVTVYDGPGTFYPVKTKANENDKFTIRATIKSDGILWGDFGSGWLDLKYTDYEDVLAQLHPEPEEWPKWGTVNATEVNVRKGPDTSFESVGKKNTGDRVQIFEEKKDGSLPWGRMEDGTWICLLYVDYDQAGETEPVVMTGLTLIKGPDVTRYVQMQDYLDTTGTVVLATYSDGSSTARTVARENTWGFDRSKLGQQTVTASYGGKTVTFQVEVVKATVTFQNYDGTVLSTQQYAYGETVTPPPNPEKPKDEKGYYKFTGWDREVVPCHGNAVYTAQFEIDENAYMPGDVNGDGKVNDIDVSVLLWHTLFPDLYSIVGDADYDGDGKVTDSDVSLLLWHTLFPDLYPLQSKNSGK